MGSDCRYCRGTNGIRLQILWREQCDQVADTVEGPIQRVMREEIMEAFKLLKIVKVPGPSEAYARVIVASGDVEIRSLMKPCLRKLDEKRMPADWATSIAIPIFKGKGDIMNCGMHRVVKLQEHAMKIVEMIPTKKWRKFVAIDDMQFGSMPGNGTTDTVIILWRIQDEYFAKQTKFNMCFVDMEKAFDRVPRKVVEWVMRKKGIPKALVRAAMSLYEGAEIKVKD